MDIFFHITSQKTLDCVAKNFQAKISKKMSTKKIAEKIKKYIKKMSGFLWIFLFFEMDVAILIDQIIKLHT